MRSFALLAVFLLPSCVSGSFVGAETDNLGAATHADSGVSRMLWFPLENPSINCTTYSGHPENACDLPTPIHTPVGAPIEGIVTRVRQGCPDNYAPLAPGELPPHATCNGRAGNYIEIQSLDGSVLVKLEHLQDDGILVKEGDHVYAGRTQVAYSGASGAVMSGHHGNGAHLHVAVKVNGTWIYPNKLWIDKIHNSLCLNCVG